MASEPHHDWKRNPLQDDHLLRKRASRFPRKIMKEGKRAPKQLASYTHRPAGRAVRSPNKAPKAGSHRRGRRHFPSPRSRKAASPGGGSLVMANKENELACAGPLADKLRQDGRAPGLGPSDSSVAQTESPSSKYSSFFSEVSQDHETMAQVLFSRNLRLNVALTFWRKRSISELVAYLVRIEDLGVVVDCLPVLTSSLQEEKQAVSLGCCVDLLPLVKSLLRSKFEEYVVVGLNWLQAVIKRWWSELSSGADAAEDGNVQILKQQLSGMWEQESHLTLVPGYTGNIAKDVDAYLLQLH
ncbi:KATNB1-like protein 1 isoform X1 [Ornithorhynchus anatinus]|uniref:Katanin regulatory subunit B1 like 1 n=1 Tax=Ornithorhynchus anatinus TaxID=9258 RepID=A0A6I8NWP3_ORNAN|nr:KATNB1-like protein 1 isoform X1 [Ornithorhynchus anatinus]